MKTWKQINSFRLFVVVGLSLTTSATLVFGDEVITKGEIFNTILQAAIVAFSFLQCPEMDAKSLPPRTRKGEERNGTT